MLFFAALAIAAFLIAGSAEHSAGQLHTVKRVIDGDTVELDDGSHVRLLAIDTPEKGQRYSEEARELLLRRVLGKTVKLEYTNEEKDKYGRLLRYIFVGSEMVNLELVREGLASSYIFIPDRYTGSILAAEAAAREAKKGIWEAEYDFCIGIRYLQYNARGNDNENLNGEFVELRNKCTRPVDISGWLLSDASRNKYAFKRVIIGPKNSVALHSGQGTDNSTDVFWGSSKAVWNNNGDTLYMWDGNGTLMLNYTY